MDTFEELYNEVVKICSWESISEELNYRLGNLCGGPEIEFLINKLNSLNNDDLVDDPGDGFDFYWRLRTSISDALFAAGEPAIKPLIAALNNSNEEVSQCAARSLGLLKAESALEAIIEKINAAQHHSGRLTYIMALGSIGNTSVVNQLIPFLDKSGEQNGDALVRTTCNALGKIGDESVCLLMCNVLVKDEAWFARLGAAEGLGLLGSVKAVPSLKRAVHDSDKRVSKAAAESLKKIGSTWPNGIRGILKLMTEKV